MKNYEPIPEHLIIRQFEDFLYSSEIPPVKPIDIVLDKKVRYQTEGDKGSETSAVYCVHSDGYPAGYILSFRHSLVINWKFDIEALKQEKEYDALYKRVKTEEYRKQAEQISLNNEQRDKQERINAAGKAKRIYDNASELTGNHAYLQRKQVRRHEGVKVLDGNLLIPLRNIKGEFMSYQTIPAEKGAKKLFCHDAPASEAFYSMGLDELEHFGLDAVLGHAHNPAASVLEPDSPQLGVCPRAESSKSITQFLFTFWCGGDCGCQEFCGISGEMFSPCRRGNAVNEFVIFMEHALQCTVAGVIYH